MLHILRFIVVVIGIATISIFVFLIIIRLIKYLGDVSDKRRDKIKSKNRVEIADEIRRSLFWIEGPNSVGIRVLLEYMCLQLERGYRVRGEDLRDKFNKIFNDK